MSNNLSLSAVSLKTTKAKGLGETSSNVVEDLSSSVTAILGDVYWSTSSMTKSIDGATNTKKLVYLGTDGKVITKNPVGTTSSFTLEAGFTAIPACKVKYNDYDFAQVGTDSNTIVFKTSLNNGSLLLENPHLVDADVVCSAYRCSSDTSSYCCAMITKEGTNYKLSYTKVGTTSQSNKTFTYTSGTLNLFVNETDIIVIETKDDGVVNIHSTMFGDISTISVMAMTTTGLTGKIGVISKTAPVFYGYKSDGLYSVTGTSSQTKVVNTSGITGIAVFTDYGTGCETGYIYRESGGDCRDNSGKRTDPIVGTMINDYNFNLVKMNATAIEA